MEIRQKITLSVDRGTMQSFYAKQNDNNTRVLEITLTKDGQPIQIPKSEKATVRYTRSDGKGDEDNAVIEGNEVIVRLTDEMLALAGTTYLDVALHNGTDILSSSVLSIITGGNPVAAEQITGSSDFLILIETLDRADKSVKDVEALIPKATQAINSANAAKTSAETATTAANAAAKRAEDAADGVTDKTLSQPDVAADAKTVGDVIKLPLVNIIKNGNFVNTDNWTTYGQTVLTAENNVGVLTTNNPTAISNLCRQETAHVVNIGDKLYVDVTLETDNLLYTEITVNLYTDTNPSATFYKFAQHNAPYAEPIKNIHFAELITVPNYAKKGNFYITINQKYKNTEDCQGKKLRISNVNIIDIDASYGNFDVYSSEVEEDIKNLGGYVDGTGNRVSMRELFDKHEYLPKFLGKTCVVLGDSIMDFCTIPEKLSVLSGMNVINAGVGGTRCGWHVYPIYDALSFYKLADSIASGDFALALENANAVGKGAPKHVKALSETDFSKVDYMLVSYGTNDFTGGNNLDDKTDMDSEKFKSFKYALEYGISTIQKKYPHIKVIIATPIFRGDHGKYEDGYSDGYTDSAGRKLIDYTDAAIAVGDKCHVPVIDQYRGLQINKDTFKFYLQNSPDDFVHPNTGVGAELIANRIYGQMLAKL